MWVIDDYHEKERENNLIVNDYLTDAKTYAENEDY